MSIFRRASAPRVLMWLSFLLACAGCTAQLEDDATLDVNGQAIINGTTTNAEHSGVVVLEEQDGTKYCSGTLMTNRLVLTAKHCIVNAIAFGASAPFTDGGGGVRDYRNAPQMIYVRMGNQRIRASAVKVWAPERPIDVTEDVALIKLESAMNMRRNTDPGKGTISDSGFQRPFYGGTIQEIGDKSLHCFGYGRFASDQPVDGTLRRAVLSSKYAPQGNGYGAAIRTDANSSGQIQASGDSGGPCFMGAAANSMTASVVSVLSTTDYCSDNIAWSDSWTDYALWYHQTAATL